MKVIFVTCFPSQQLTWSFVFAPCFSEENGINKCVLGIRLTFFFPHYYLAVTLCPLKYLFVQDQHVPLGKAPVVWSVYRALLFQLWHDGVHSSTEFSLCCLWNHSPALTFTIPYMINIRTKHFSLAITQKFIQYLEGIYEPVAAQNCVPAWSLHLQ